MLLGDKIRIQTALSCGVWVGMTFIVGFTPVLITFAAAVVVYNIYHMLTTRTQDKEKILNKYYKVAKDDYMRNMEILARKHCKEHQIPAGEETEKLVKEFLEQERAVLEERLEDLL